MACVVRPLPFQNTIKARATVREAVSMLSSGPLYATMNEWYSRVTTVCVHCGYSVAPLPTIHARLEEQLDPFYLHLYRGGEQVGAIYVSIYCTPCGRYEIVAYVV